ncbi:phosphoglycerate kinase [Candidatus Woesearchaeota archaeon]|nr:phosphoglycerate kinase [Candidatus Woesearchaeota archaeon]
MLKLTDIDFKNKRVLLRAVLNVPVKNGKVVDDSRIRSVTPTINYILKENPKQIVIISHMGRPEGKVVEDLRLTPAAETLSKLLKRKITKLDDCINIKIPNDKIVLLENLRFHAEEEKNDEMFARKLAAYADVYVNEAFPDSAKSHASIVGVLKFIPGCAGLQFQKEVENLSLKNVKKPAIAIMGGAKVSDKIELIENMLKKVDVILLGGAMIFTFFKALGFEVGKSKLEEEKVNAAKKLLEQHKKQLVLPIDVLVADEIKEDAVTRTAGAHDIRKDEIGVDIGEQTVAAYEEMLKMAKTVVWNGPLGIIEIKEFSKGTEEIAKHIAELDAKTIVGGGETGEVVHRLNLDKKMTFVSTAGGAALNMLEGKVLPGIKALNDNEKKFS